MKLMEQQEARHNAAMDKMKALLAAAMDKKTAPKKKYHEKKPPRRSPRKRPRVRYDTPERTIERSDSYQKQLGKTRQAKSDSMKQLRKDIGIRVAALEPGLVEVKYTHPVTHRFLGNVFEDDIRPSLDLLMGDDMDPATTLVCFQMSKDIAQKRRRYLLGKITKNKNKEDVLRASKALSKRVQASLKARANHEDKSEAPNPNTHNAQALRLPHNFDVDSLARWCVCVCVCVGGGVRVCTPTHTRRCVRVRVRVC